MTTKTLTIAEFLLARLAEDAVSLDHVVPAQEDRWFDREGNDAARRINAALRRCHAEIAAKRSVLGLLSVDCEDPGNAVRRSLAFETLQLFAAVHADHPDYREEWRD